jgi:hypothetical protein
MKAINLAQEINVSLSELKQTLRDIGYNAVINENTLLPEEIEDLIYRTMGMSDSYEVRAINVSDETRRVGYIMRNLDNLEEYSILMSSSIIQKICSDLIKDGICDEGDVECATRLNKNSNSKNYYIFSSLDGYGLMNKYFDRLTRPKYSEIVIDGHERIFAKFNGEWGEILPELNYVFKPHYDRVIPCLSHGKKYRGFDVGISGNKYALIDSYRNVFKERNSWNDFDYASGFDYGFSIVKSGSNCYLIDEEWNKYAYINKKGQLYYNFNEWNLKKGFHKIKYIKPFYGIDIKEFVFICEDNVIIKVDRDDFILGYKDFIQMEDIAWHYEQEEKNCDSMLNGKESSTLLDIWDAMTDGKYGEMPSGFNGDFDFLGK